MHITPGFVSARRYARATILTAPPQSPERCRQYSDDFRKKLLSMTKLNQIVATIYKGYVDKRLDIPYFRAMLTVVFLLYLHFIQIVMLIDLPSKFILPFVSENKNIEWLEDFFYFLGLVGICCLFFPKSKLDQQQISESSIKRMRKIIALYFVLTFSILTLLLIAHGIKKGTIHI